MEGPEAPLYGFTASIPAVMVSIIFASIIYLLISKSKRKGAPRDPKLPPQIKTPRRDHVKRFVAVDGPEYMLKVTREIGCADYEAPTASIPFIPQVFILTDYRSARKVFEDVGSFKPVLTNIFFKRTTHNGENILSAEGHRWKHVKKSTSTAFSAANLKKMVDPIDTVLETWTESVLEPCMRTQTPINILDEMNKITANVIVNVAFDYCFELGERESLLSDLSTCWQEFGVESPKNPLSTLPVIELCFPCVWRGRCAAKHIHDFCCKMLQAYREKNNVSNSRKEHKLIDMIMYDMEYLDDGERCRDMTAYLIAGFDTTASTLAFALRELAMNQNEQKKLRNELRSQQSPNDARNCKQLKMTIKETLRMYPATAMGTIRGLGKDVVLPWSEKVLPKGSWARMVHYCIQRDSRLFNDPNTFSPNRWENPTSEQAKSFIPFSSGRRSCQGQGLANLEMNEVLYKLISKYRFDVVEKGELHSIVIFKPMGTLLSVSLAD